MLLCRAAAQDQTGNNCYCFCVCVPLLSRLYRSLEDYDVVRGIFAGKVGTKSITCAALQAEANSDFAEAVKLYNEVTQAVAFPSHSRSQLYNYNKCYSCQ